MDSFKVGVARQRGTETSLGRGSRFARWSEVDMQANTTGSSNSRAEQVQRRDNAERQRHADGDVPARVLHLQTGEHRRDRSAAPLRTRGRGACSNRVHHRCRQAAGTCKSHEVPKSPCVRTAVRDDRQVHHVWSDSVRGQNIKVSHCAMFTCSQCSGVTGNVA